MNILFWIITSFLILNGILFILISLPIGIASFEPISLAFGFLSMVWSIFRIQKYKRMRNAGYKYMREYNQHLKAINAGFDSIEAYNEFRLLEANKKAEEKAEKERKREEAKKERKERRSRAETRWRSALVQRGVSQSDIGTVVVRYGHGPHGFFRKPSEEDLMKLPGIGQVTAKKFIAVGKLKLMD